MALTRPSHELRSDSEEMRAALPVHGALIDQFQVGLVNDLSGLENMSGSFAAHVVVGEPAQLLIDER